MRKQMIATSVIALTFALSQLSMAQLLHQTGGASVTSMNQAKAGSISSADNAASSAHLAGAPRAATISADSASSESASSKLKSGSAISAAHLQGVSGAHLNTISSGTTTSAASGSHLKSTTASTSSQLTSTNGSKLGNKTIAAASNSNTASTITANRLREFCNERQSSEFKFQQSERWQIEARRQLKYECFTQREQGQHQRRSECKCDGSNERSIGPHEVGPGADQSRCPGHRPQTQLRVPALTGMHKGFCEVLLSYWYRRKFALSLKFESILKLNGEEPRAMKVKCAVVVLLFACAAEAKSPVFYDKGELVKMDSVECGVEAKGAEGVGGVLGVDDSHHTKTSRCSARNTCCARQKWITKSVPSTTSILPCCPSARRRSSAS